MKKLVSPKQVAQAIGVSESSLKRWCDQGRIETVRTAGGHRRLPLDQVIEFLRETGHPVVRPALIGLPSTTGRGETVIERARGPFCQALLTGDEEQCRRIVFDLHLAGHPVHAIGDRVISPAFRDIGEFWSHGEAEVYQERRGCDICQRVLSELRTAIPWPPQDAPVAMGGTPECDPYTLPTAMVELVLRQAGWKSQSLGSRLPFATLASAIADMKPAIFWLSVSHIDDEEQFLTEYAAFYDQVRTTTAIVVGGRVLTEPRRQRMQYAAHCDQLHHLVTFAQTLSSVAKSPGDSQAASRTQTAPRAQSKHEP